MITEKIWGFVILSSESPEGHLRFLPPECTDLLIYSLDPTPLFTLEPVGNHAGQTNDLPDEIWAKASEMGMYKLDIAVRIIFPALKGANLRKAKP